MDYKEKYKLYQGNSVDVLKTLESNSVQCCITSPPYYGLRDYGTGHWEGGNSNCPHYQTNRVGNHCATGHNNSAQSSAIYKSFCPLCGAIRVDEQIGLEETPEEYIDKLVELFREVKRVLKDDGTLWINIGDSYATNSHSNHNFNYDDGRGSNNENICNTKTIKDDVKQKDLVGIPWMLAFALRKDGWYLRQDIIWKKQNPMPEPVKDRCVKSHEYIFLLSKKPQYYFDYEAIQEECRCEDNRAPGVVRNRVLGYNSKLNNNPEKYLQENNGIHSSDIKYYTDEYLYNGKKNKRDVWETCVNSSSISHFATYPIELILPCVLAGTKVGDTILDPFNGSGTTGVASIQYNRNYIGIDLSQEYLDITEKRFMETFERIKPIEDKKQDEYTKDIFDLL